MNRQRVLVIDDQPTIRRFVEIVLEHRGYQVMQAADGAEGLDLAFRHRPDLVLLDHSLPTMSGEQVAQRLPGGTPVVALTGLDATALGWSLPIRGVLPKPFTPEALIGAVEGALGTRQPLSKAS
jgi:DNA-binding response OmpR family regulator